MRNLPVFGYVDQEGHAELTFEDVRVPAANLIANEGDGFADRAGAARPRADPPLHAHDRRGRAGARADVPARAASRTTFGEPVAERSNIQDWIAESRIEIEMARLLTLKTAWLMDTVGNKHARDRDRARSRSPPRTSR